jgi:hypothetical protein
MANDAPASLTFLPWVRQGAASLIATPDTLGAQQHGVVDLSATLSVNTTVMPPIAVRLRGPADVVGIDANQIVRREPPPGTADFEPNYFPCIEFDRADFPWLFTPASAAGNARLRPWLALVVVRKQNGVTLASTVNAPLPSLQIASPANPVVELPDLGESWAWAHGQAAGAESTAGAVRAALEGAPSLSLSRLICPRVLAPNTAYIACVVPSFELGSKAGLGVAIADADLVSASAMASAWSLSPAPTQVTLPVYHSWEFQTGPGGDFASLAARLRPLPPPATLGQRLMDISRPGFLLPASFPAGTTLVVGGALRPVLPTGNPDPLTDWPDVTALPFQTALAAIVNAPGQLAVSDPTADPLLAPPLYGRWYAARATTTHGAADWFDQLNLDPRLRGVAAFGTRVVQKYQEALMASAWEQAGEIQRANQRLRQLQMSLVVGASLQARHFTNLADEAMLRVSAPVLSRIGLSSVAGTQTMLAQVRTTSIPVQALAPAIRRIGRERGPLTRRIAAGGGARFTRGTWVATLEAGTAVLPAPSPLDLATMSAVSAHMAPPGTFRTYVAVTSALIGNWDGVPWFVVRAEGQSIPMELSFSHGPAANDSPSARAFRRAAVEHLTRIDPERGASVVPPPTPVPLSTLRGTLSQQIQPQQTIGGLAQGIVSVAFPSPRVRATELTATSAGVAAGSLDTVMWAPSFPQPMYEPLRDLSQELLLPGLDNVEPDCVLGLETNRRFIESFLVGLNVEMGRELLWRGFPTDQLGTYFDQFWGGGPDIPPLHLWSTRALGDAPTPRESFVMLMRSALLRRYPNAILYLTPAMPSAGGRTPSLDPADEKLPVFSGAAEPDINFVGFNVPADQVANGSPDHPQGYYLVIQQHPTEPRFGLPDGITLGGASHVSIAAGPPANLPLNGLQWGLNAAHMAGILRRLPVRLAIHASQFFTSATTAPHP